jgi:DNA-binding Xre family transcriptional regulator
MDTNQHPLSAFLKSKSIKKTDFAQAAGISRTHLHRIMRGDSTSLTTLAAISAATGHKVSEVALLKAVKAKQTDKAGAGQ